MIKHLLCKDSSTLKEVLEVIDSNGKGTAFIIDINDKLKGVITDGDIRRLIINGFGTDEIVLNHLSKNFVFGKNKEPYEQLIQKINKKIKIIPIVDNNLRVVDFFEVRNEIRVPVTAPDLTGNELKYLTDAFLSTWISSSGNYINRFETDFSSFCQSKYGVAVSNGTVALHLALEALGIGQGDEVIVPDLTFAATINAVIHANATPVIVDIELDSWCINPSEIEKAITSRTKAIIPVHLYGQVCDMEAIMKIAKKYNLYVIEDCAEAHGAQFKNMKVGSIGHIGCFSFFGNKIITTGEGGMCTTNDNKIYERLKLLRDHGMSSQKKYWHEVVGYNYRMTNLQAAIGVAQLERIESILEKRKKIEAYYRKILHDLSIIKFQKDDFKDRKKVTWLVSILIEDSNRDRYIKKFKEAGIDVRPFFYPLSEMEIYKKFVFTNTNSKIVSQKGLNLPDIFDNNKNIGDKIRHIFTGDFYE